jgi:hypothetical protein
MTPEEVQLYTHGRSVLSAAKPVAQGIAMEFSRLERLLARLDTANGDVLAAALAEDGELYAAAKLGTLEWLTNLQLFLQDWAVKKGMLTLLETPEVSELIAALIEAGTPPEPAPE